MRALVCLLGLAALGAAGNPQHGGVALELGSHASGDSPAHRLTFEIVQGQLEPFRVRLRYPPAFRFAGFDDGGRPPAQVGVYEMDANFDGTPDRVVPILSASARTAYADLLADGAFSPELEPAFRYVAGGEFELRLPFGGDANADTLVAPFGARVALVLAEGLLENPAIGGRYVVSANLLSVDPDTGDADDGSGMPPQAAAFELAVEIEGPPDAPFARLRIDDFDIKREGRNRDRFTMRGRYLSGPASNGIDLAREHVSLSFEGFWQAIPGTAFATAGGVSRFTARDPGITSFTLFPDGRFLVDARGLTLRVVGPGPVKVALRIGNDHGEAWTSLDDSSAR